VKPDPFYIFGFQLNFVSQMFGAVQKTSKQHFSNSIMEIEVVSIRKKTNIYAVAIKTTVLTRKVSEYTNIAKAKL